MKQKNKFDKWFLLSWKRFLFILIAFIIAVLLHNLIYGLGIYFGGRNFWGVGGDEPFFFIIATILIPLYFIICIVYSLIKKFSK